MRRLETVPEILGYTPKGADQDTWNQVHQISSRCGVIDLSPIIEINDPLPKVDCRILARLIPSSLVIPLLFILAGCGETSPQPQASPSLEEICQDLGGIGLCEIEDKSSEDRAIKSETASLEGNFGPATDEDKKEPTCWIKDENQGRFVLTQFRKKGSHWPAWFHPNYLRCVLFKKEEPEPSTTPHAEETRQAPTATLPPTVTPTATATTAATSTPTTVPTTMKATPLPTPDPTPTFPTYSPEKGTFIRWEIVIPSGGLALYAAGKLIYNLVKVVDAIRSGGNKEEQ
jgi:hypothetical protein